MAPPLHVKVISLALNVQMLSAGLRNVFSTGTPLRNIPEDAAFQEFFHGTKDAKMAFIFQCFGVLMATVSVAKLTTVFAQTEGTFLRQKLFFVFGLSDLAFAYVMRSYDGLEASVTQGFVALLALEGVAYVCDAIFRSRPTKAKAKGA